MNRIIVRTVSALASATITLAVLLGVGKIADTQSATYPEVLARAKAREAASAPVSVATVSTGRAAR